VPTDDFAQLQLQLVEQTQWRYEVIRPIVLFADRTPRQREDETDTHPATVRTLTRRFRQQGMVGLLPEDGEVSVRAGAAGARGGARGAGSAQGALRRLPLSRHPPCALTRGEASLGAPPVQSVASPSVLGAPYQRYGGALCKIPRITRTFCTHPPYPCQAWLESRKRGGSAAWWDKARESETS
jgi:hypothetical protein